MIRDRHLAVACLLVAPAVLVSGISCTGSREISAERSLAAAFSRDRNLELRLPAMPYARVVPAGARAYQPLGSPELAEAEAAILRRNRSDSASPQALVLLSRVHLLRGNWDRALDAARAAYDVEPRAALTDVGVAWLARGIAQQRPRDLQLAIENLSEVLAVNARDPVALFNRAIAFEKLFLYRRAAADYDAYLLVDTQSGWAGECRQRLLRIRQVLAAWQSKREWFDAAEETYLQHHENAPAELFLDAAVTKWIRHLVDSDSGGASKARKALTLLARHLAERHEDSWLRELLLRPEPVPAFLELASAVQANRDARRDEGLARARTAKQLFLAGSNFAGAARAWLEEIYALSRSFNSGGCLREATALTRLVESRPYPWIQGQLRLEESVCALHKGEFETAQKRVELALEGIAASRYETLRLRGLGVQASFHTLLGNTSQAAFSNWRGLDLFWKGIHPPGRAYQFYSDFSLAAEREQLWRSAYAFAQEAVDNVALGPNRLTDAMARTRLAAFALRVGDTAVATQQAEHVERLLERFAEMVSAREYRVENQIVLTSAYLAAGNTEKAAQTLSSLRRDVGSVLTRLALHRTAGLLHDQKQDWKQARREFLTAAEVSRTALPRLGDDASRLRWKREAGLVFRRLARIALEREGREKALGFWEWFRSAPVGDQLPAVPRIETAASALQSQLASYSTTTILSWAQIDDRLAIWVLDDRGVQFSWSPAPASHARSLCTRFLRLCSRPDSNLETIRGIGRELYSALIAPVANHLVPGRVLLLEPDAVPGAVAFEALVEPDGRWFGEHFTMITSPGVWAELNLRRMPSVVSRSSAALVVANPLSTATGSDFLVPLAEAEREGEAVAAMFSSSRSLTSAAATSSAVASALSAAEVFHFTGHARFDGETARLAVAGKAASLDAETIERSAKRCRLAVLSACSTAASERDGPWNVESLVQAFWRAGTPQVVASRWEVDSTLTARLFTTFYTHLLNGDAAAEALRRAAAEIRTQRGSEHPFFWAAFHVFGSSSHRKEMTHGERPQTKPGAARHLGN